MTLEISQISKILFSLFKENTIGPPFSGIHLKAFFFHFNDDFELLQVVLFYLLKSNKFTCDMAKVEL